MPTNSHQTEMKWGLVWFLWQLGCCSCAGDTAAKSTDGSSARTWDDTWVYHHRVSTGCQLLAKGRASCHQLRQVPSGRLWRGGQHSRSQSENTRHWAERLWRVYLRRCQRTRTGSGNYVSIRYDSLFCSNFLCQFIFDNLLRKMYCLLTEKRPPKLTGGVWASCGIGRTNRSR